MKKLEKGELMRRKMKNKLKSYSFIILIAVLISLPLFSVNYNIYNDDGVQHVCRMMGTYQSITEGQTFPVIMSQFCNGFGYSWNLFYSPITAYIPLLFHFITNSFVLDIKIFIVLVNILSGITMYELLQTVTKNKYASLLGVAIYILAPYRLTDMYIRMALAELTSFAFLPLVFQGLYMLFHQEEIETKKPELILMIGSIGLILTHLIIAMYAAIIAFIYLLINIKQFKNKIIFKKLLISFIFIVCVTSFFLLPMLEQKMSTEYEVFKSGRMERTDVLIYNKLDLLDFIYTQKGKMVFEIGFVTIIGLVLNVFAYKKIDKRYKKFYLFSLTMGISSIIMSLKIFPFEKLPAIFKMLQFSFRMLEFSSFFFAIIVGINFGIVIKDFKMKDVVVLTGIIALLLVPMIIRNIPYKEKIREESSLWTAVRVTEKTGRVHAGCASFEYLPSKAFEHLDYIKKRENNVSILEGTAEITKQEKYGINMSFEITNVEANTRLELPYIYYSGYEVILKTREEEKKISTYESENGFVQITLDDGVEEGKIIIDYSGTMIMKISMVISIIGFSTMILYGFWKRDRTLGDAIY